MSMSDSSRDNLHTLIEVWSIAHGKGVELTPEQLLPNDQTAREELRRQLAARRALDDVTLPHDKAPAAAGGNDPTMSLTGDDSTPRRTTGEATVMACPPGYTIIGELGRGGMGIVYHAVQTALKREVALKTIRDAAYADTADLLRFWGEAETVASLRHPNIVALYDYGKHEGRPYMAMEYLSGGTMGDRMGEGRPMDPRDAAKLLEQVCRGVAAAHEKQIIHRDLKPGNILFDERSNPKVADFGLAKRASSDLTGDRDMMGTPAYMAPEQAAGRTRFVGPPADVWALGVLLYESLSGARPFTGESVGEVLNQVLRKEPAAIRTISKGIPGDLEIITRKCLEKEPHLRYPHAGELGDDLQRWIKGEPILARRSNIIEKTRKWIRRNPAIAALSGGLALALLLGAILSTIGFLRAKEALGIAEANERKAIFERDEKEKARAAEAEQKREVTRQKTEVEKQRDRAIQAERDTKVFSDFLVNDVIASARPENQGGGLGIKTTIVEALQSAEGRIGGRFQGRPLAEATARNALGLTWRILGKYEQAAGLLDAALDIRQAKLGKADPLTLATRTNLAITLRDLGKTPEAVKLMESVVADSTAALGADDPETLNRSTNLAGLYLKGNQFARAIPMLEANLRSQWKNPLDQAAYLMDTSNFLAQAYGAVGQTDKAIETLEKMLKIEEKLPIEEYPVLTVAMHDLAAAYQAKGRLPEAITLFEATLAKQADKLGKEHPYTQKTKASLANAYREDRKYDKAIVLFQEVLPAMQKAGPASADTLSVMNILAVCLQATGKPDEAIALLRESLKIRKEHHADSWSTFNTMSRLGEALMEQKKIAEAEPLLVEGYEGLAKREAQLSAPAKPRLGEALERLAKFYDLVDDKPKKARYQKLLEEWKKR